jgi:hypothetical protein
MLSNGRREGGGEGHDDQSLMDKAYRSTGVRARPGRPRAIAQAIVLAEDALSLEHVDVAMARGRLSGRIAVAPADDVDDHLRARAQLSSFGARS